MDTYNEKSCNALEKPYYQPIEAALRWCGLASHESEILKATGDSVLPPVSAFPRWPCLRANAEKILEAMECGELTISRDGRPVPAGDHVARHRRTVRHADLKAWMSKHYPDQKPALKLPLEMGVLSFVQNVDKELRNGGKASTCGIHAGI